MSTYCVLTAEGGRSGTILNLPLGRGQSSGSRRQISRNKVNYVRAV